MNAATAGEAVAWEVIVAGAGPAGVATAVAAVRAAPSLAGRVLVVDKASFPRGKPCGGGLTGHVDEGLAALGLSLAVPSFSSPSALVRYGAQTRTVTLGRPVRTVRREEFDHSLVTQARSLGVTVRERTALLGYRAGDDGVEIETTGGTLRAQVLVGADGAGSIVRKVLGDRERARPIRLFRAELPDRGWHRAEMLYDFTPMLDGLRGYLWIFPVPGGLLNVGLMHDPRVPMSGGDLAALLAVRLRDHGIDLSGAQLRGWPAWGYLPSQRVSSARVLTVGDAAGIDALTGEGIAVALEQGLVAGRAIATAFATRDFRFGSYRRALRTATVGRELSLDRWLAAMLYGSADYRLWLSLVLHDEQMLELYAARVSGSMVLSDHKFELVRALASHAVRGRARMRKLREVETAMSGFEGSAA